MRIGVNPLIWMNDDRRELGADIPLERCLAEAREAGFSAIELGHRFPRTASALRPLLARHGLALISGWYGARLLERRADGELAAMRPHLGLLRAMGCDTVIFCDVTDAIHCVARPLSHRPVLDTATWRAFVRELDLLARALEGEGVRLAYHHHMGMCVQTPAEIARLLDDTSDAVGLNVDTGHLAWACGDGVPVHRWVERFADRIAHVHLKDVRHDVLARARDEDLAFLDAVCGGVFTVPGDGDLDLARVISALRRARYEGWVVVEAEQDPELAHPLTYARLGFAGATDLVSDAPAAIAPSRVAGRGARSRRRPRTRAATRAGTRTRPSRRRART